MNSGSHRLVSLGVLFANLKPPCVKEDPHIGHLMVMCIFQFESQMLRFGYFEREILLLTSVAMFESGQGSWRHTKNFMCIISLHLLYITSCPVLFHRHGHWGSNLLKATRKWMEVKFIARAPFDRILQHSRSDLSLIPISIAETDLQKHDCEVNLPCPPAHDLYLE